MIILKTANRIQLVHPQTLEVAECQKCRHWDELTAEGEQKKSGYGQCSRMPALTGFSDGCSEWEKKIDEEWIRTGRRGGE